MLSTGGSQKFAVAKPRGKAPGPPSAAKYVSAPEQPESVKMNRGGFDVETGAKQANQGKGTFSDWVMRNRIMLALCLLGLIGFIMAMLWLFKPCPRELISVSSPVDMVFTLDGSGSVNENELKNLMQASQIITQKLGANVSDIRIGVTYWGSNEPTVELALTDDIEKAEEALDPATPFARRSNLDANTWFATALTSCANEFASSKRTKATDLPVYPLCLLVSDGQNNDDNNVFRPGNGGFNTQSVIDFCDRHAVSPCRTSDIADMMRNTLNITVFGLYIGSNAVERRQLCDVSSCSSTECSTQTCDMFAEVSAGNNFAGVKDAADTLARDLISDVPSSTTSVCIDDPFGLLFLLFFLPLAIYLLWRPLSIIKAKYITPMTPEEARQSFAQPPPTPEAPEGAKRFRWSIKAADAYLWDLGGGGCRPLGVDFGSAAPPSAPKLDARRASNAVLRDAFTWEPKARTDVYRVDEVQPGDIDYEYTLCLMRCCPCLRPKEAI
jgi:hypothetical protein